LTVRVLVAGGAGLLGSAVATGLLAEGNRVVAADHFDDSGDGRVVKEHRAELLDAHAGAAVERADLSDAGDLARLFERHRPAAVVNAALFDPFRPDAGALMKASRAAGTGLFVHLSTGELYAPGAAPGVPAPEEEAPDARGDIALTSRLIEERRLAELGLPFVNLRLFDVVGPLFPPRRFPVEAFEAILSEEEAFLQDERWRDFVHVDDVVRAVTLALTRRPVGATLNVGGGLAVNPRTFLALLARKAGKETNLTVLPPAAPGHPRIAALDAAWQSLGWAPTYTLDGLCESIVRARLSPSAAPAPRRATDPSWGHPEPEEPPKPVSRRELFDLFRRPFRGGER
jgi:UDP-glucose 4-epimerase